MLILMTRESCADANPTEKRGGERKYRPYQRHLCIPSHGRLVPILFFARRPQQQHLAAAFASVNVRGRNIQALSSNP